MNEANPSTAAVEKPRYEKRDADFVMLALLGVLLIIGGILVHLATAGFASWLNRGHEVAVKSRPAPLYPEPRLQVAPAADLGALRAHEESILHSYGWVDRPAGVVRIPIERSMELLLQRGLPETAPLITPAELQRDRPVGNTPGKGTPPP